MDISENKSAFEKSCERLEEIVAQVRAKDVPLAQCLDLYEEAIELGTQAAALIDRTDFSFSELEAADDGEADPAESSEAEGTQEQASVSAEAAE